MDASAPPPTWRFELPHTTAAVPMARCLVRTALASLDTGPCEDTAELLTAELVANAVEHTAGTGPLELVLELRETGCHVEVHDPLPARPGELIAPGPVEPPDPWQEHGRGLMLIRTLSAACGHRPTDRGKAVWFRLPRVPAQRRRTAV
ncbi:ATP-binding protein [Streptomyces sp. NPDC048604]|uniref:ATP-binding protein n=1 Tax=Streptomyces sp. NPDC048604 TaxID=3365578 RepID=UPI00371C8364